MRIFALIIVLIIYTLIIFFIGVKVISFLKLILPFISSKILWPLIFIFAYSLFAFYFLPATSFLAKALRIISGYWMGFFMYTFLGLIAIYIIKLLLKLTPMRKNPLIMDNPLLWGSILSVVLIFIFSYGSYKAFHLVNKEYSIEINKNSPIENLKVVMVSDIHLGYTIGSSHIDRIVDKINREEPDIVFIVGDTFDNSYEAVTDIDKISDALKGIKSTYGAYGVLGNHDVTAELKGRSDKSPDYTTPDDDMISFFEKSEITLLRDETILIKDAFYLVGRKDASPIGAVNYERAEVPTLLEGIDTKKPVILLDHQPARFSTISEGIDLVVSGHTHNGQVFPGNIIVHGIYDNGYGYKQEGNLQSIVTSGAGVWGPPLRLASDSEVVTVNISFQKP
ncbi:metallophosphoesterase [Alloiococcus sp. CFN-8]|uniref:metallophosphoesterase n=1 Tax=Alloiococcus sp. CFN-8 TaxID=3416081 RepID=UPI003CF1A2DE